MKLNGKTLEQIYGFTNELAYEEYAQLMWLINNNYE
jgi:hypothetical protein